MSRRFDVQLLACYKSKSHAPFTRPVRYTAIPHGERNSPTRLPHRLASARRGKARARHRTASHVPRSRGLPCLAGAAKRREPVGGFPASDRLPRKPDRNSPVPTRQSMSATSSTIRRPAHEENQQGGRGLQLPCRPCSKIIHYHTAPTASKGRKGFMVTFHLLTKYLIPYSFVVAFFGVVVLQN
jgi:hypothetical protein